jgi:hypothetical protein
MGGTYGNKQLGMRTGCRVLVGKFEGKSHPVDVDGIIMLGLIVRKYGCDVGG